MTTDIPVRPAGSARATGADRLRAAAVVLTAVGQVGAGFLSSLLPGTEDIGAIADRYDSPLQPADYAFAVWGPIFLASLAVAVYQALPGQVARTVHRRTGWWLAAAFAANTAWELLYASGEVLALAQVLIAAIAVPLAVAYARLQDLPVERADRWLLRPAVALFLGWVTVANVANAGSTAVYLGGPSTGAGVDVAAALALLAAGGIVGYVVARSRVAAGPLAFASAWALVGIVASGRSPLVTAAAAAAAALVVVAIGVKVVRSPDRRAVAVG